ncbi:putative quinol monooxygenase [Streptomyces sp. NPDC018029]|uniref:putative quinol monooxygenase n=1 Tax=Streptomyces sp. NPDC018029 TaxID=3365032 RepID=UPI0037BA8863
MPAPGTRERLDALARMRPLCLAEDGCVSWEAYHSHEDPARFVLVERWATRGHWETHDAGEAIQKIYLPEIMPRIEREVHPSAPAALGEAGQFHLVDQGEGGILR